MNKTGKKQILYAASLMFTMYGLRGTTVDEIFRSIGISKKTFYLFYTNKDQLIKEFIEVSFLTIGEAFAENLSKNNVLHNFKEFDSKLVGLLGIFYPHVILDIPYYEEAHTVFIGQRAHIIKNLAAIIEQGKQQRIFRDNVNAQIISELRLIELESTFSMAQEIEPGHLHTKQQEYFLHYLAGLLSKY